MYIQINDPIGQNKYCPILSWSCLPIYSCISILPCKHWKTRAGMHAYKCTQIPTYLLNWASRNDHNVYKVWKWLATSSRGGSDVSHWDFVLFFFLLNYSDRKRRQHAVQSGLICNLFLNCAPTHLTNSLLVRSYDVFDWLKYVARNCHKRDILLMLDSQHRLYVAYSNSDPHWIFRIKFRVA